MESQIIAQTHDEYFVSHALRIADIINNAKPKINYVDGLTYITNVENNQYNGEQDD